MNVSLTPEIEQFVAEQVAAGRYRSASEAVRDALRLLQEREAERGAKLEALRTSVGVGLAELDRGEALSGEQVFPELLGTLDESGTA